MLVRAAVDRERQQVLADAAVVEQRVALAGRAVPRDRLALAGGGDQELDQIGLDREDVVGEARVALDRVQPGVLFVFSTLSTRSDGSPAVSTGVDMTRSEPPWVTSSWTSTTFRPALASAAEAVRRVRYE